MTYFVSESFLHNGAIGNARVNTNYRAITVYAVIAGIYGT